MNKAARYILIGEYLLCGGIAILGLCAVLRSHEDRIVKLERANLKTTEELIEQANRVIKTGKTM